MFFAQINFRNGRGSTVFARNRYAIPHKMFQTGCHMVLVYSIRIFSLESFYCFDGHLGIDVTVLTIAFPHTRPARIASQVHNRSICPRDTTGFCLVGRYFARTAYQFAVEGGRHVNSLWKEGTVKGIGCTMNLVYTIDTRDANLL